uniref:Protein kinase domain-containing protein n=1 Tax=Oryza nivara TaxID=4536 RepID=A0A0E0J6A2_ORYNI
MTHEEEEADLERGIHSILKNHPIMKKLNKGIHPVVLALHVLLEEEEEEEEEEEVVQEEDMAKGLAELDEYLSRHTYHTIEEGKHKILVSEYIENGSLAHKLFGRDGFDDDVLDWNQRFRIALCVAKGLAYLHSECSEWIVPCDMRPENILLDKDLEPKITDFGLSKLLNRDGSDAILTRIRGTRGYMAPEWVTNLPVIEKVDVYSYGVILLELVKGIWISEWVIHGIKVCEMDIRIVVRVTREKMESNEEKSIEDLVDYRLNGDFNHVQVKLMLEIALSCLEEDRSKRPNMNSVVQALISFEG